MDDKGPGNRNKNPGINVLKAVTKSRFHVLRTQVTLPS